MSATSSQHPRTVPVILLTTLAAGLIFLWILLAPPGLAGKLWAIGYSVCHQIVSHSYMINGMQLPLCARCTGLFLGGLSTLIILATQGRKGGFPAIQYRWILSVFLLAFILDGLNSTFAEFIPSLSIYPPSNLLRLITGVLMGVALGAVLMCLWNQILWKDALEAPLLHSYRQLLMLLGAGGLVILAVVSGSHALYFPLAVLSTGGVFIMITAIYILLWALVLKKENTYSHWRDLGIILLLGLNSALIQITVMNGVRFLLTRTWAGIAL